MLCPGVAEDCQHIFSSPFPMSADCCAQSFMFCTLDGFDAAAGASGVSLVIRPSSVKQQTLKQWAAFKVTCQSWRMWICASGCMRQAPAIGH